MPTLGKIFIQVGTPDVKLAYGKTSNEPEGQDFVTYITRKEQVEEGH